MFAVSCVLSAETVPTQKAKDKKQGSSTKGERFFFAAVATSMTHCCHPDIGCFRELLGFVMKFKPTSKTT
jgi:hypothetical protein